jgi:hypothetical protein
MYRSQVAHTAGLKDPVPGMDLRPCLRMRAQKVVKDMQKDADMVPVAPGLGFPDVIDDHAANLFGAVFLVSQIGSIGSRRDFRHVLMLGDRQNLFLSQVAETDAILKRNHGAI